MVSCLASNDASIEFIENNGVILKDIVFITEENDTFRVYNINAKESLEK